MDFFQEPALSPLDDRYRDALSELRQQISEQALVVERVGIEVAWLKKLSQIQSFGVPVRDKEVLSKALSELNKMTPASIYQAVKTQESSLKHDVKAVEVFLRDFLREHRVGESTLALIHLGCTSEDINNTAISVMVRNGYQTLAPHWQDIVDQFRRWAATYSDLPMLARTHGQPASPTTLGKEMAVLGHRSQRQVSSLMEWRPLAKFNGATGQWNAHSIAFPDIDWIAVTDDFLQSIGLEVNPYTTQIEDHDRLCELFSSMNRFHRILIDAARDFWGYISLDYLRLKKQPQEVGSSTMPHKVNPIHFENAEGNLAFANSVGDFFCNKLPISRWQRDLSDSTVMRNFGVYFGHSLLGYKSFSQGMERISANEIAIRSDLSDHWEVLGEAIQTVARAEGIPDAYEAIKHLTRGHSLDQDSYSKIVQSMSFSPEARQKLENLSPSTYVGYAPQLAKRFGKISKEGA